MNKYEAMNAKTAGDKLQKLIDSGDYIAEIKLDGYRAICENGRFFSRLGNELTEKVPHLQLPKNAVFDGELLFGKNSSDVTKVLGSKTERALQLQETEKVCYVIFDILELDGEDLTGEPFVTRRDLLRDVDNVWSGLRDALQLVQTSPVYADPLKALQLAEKTSAEGIMLKNINSEYFCGKRPENVWYKVKKHATADVRIVGFLPGKGKYNGLIGSVEFVDEKGNTGSCGGMTDEQRLTFTGNQALFVGQTIEIGYMERTAKGGYRHPVYKCLRTDKKV